MRHVHPYHEKILTFLGLNEDQKNEAEFFPLLSDKICVFHSFTEYRMGHYLGKLCFVEPLDHKQIKVRNLGYFDRVENIRFRSFNNKLLYLKTYLPNEMLFSICDFDNHATAAGKVSKTDERYLEARFLNENNLVILEKDGLPQHSRSHEHGKIININELEWVPTEYVSEEIFEYPRLILPLSREKGAA